MKGSALDGLKRYKQALDAYSAAIGLDPTNSEFCYKRYHFTSPRSNTFLWLKKYHEALDEAERCIDLNGKYAFGHHARGNALFGLERIEEAVKCYMTAIELDPHRREFYYGKNICIERIRQCA